MLVDNPQGQLLFVGSDMSCSLNSLKGAIQGRITGVVNGDARSFRRGLGFRA